jgi:uncharacterized protein (TIGR04255 family)
MSNSKDFENPSLKEAICEIIFTTVSSDPDWSKRIPHKLSSILQNDYPLFEVLDEAPFRFEFGGNQISPSMHKFKYSSENQRHIITVKQNSFAYSIKPDEDERYSWNTFHEKLCAEWDRLKTIIEAHSINRVGMRFINFLEINESVFPESLLNHESKYIPKAILENPQNFFNKSDFSLDKNNKFIIHLLYRDSTNSTAKELIFDIDRITENDNISVDNLYSTSDKIHKDIENVFFSSITDEYKDIMRVR